MSGIHRFTLALAGIALTFSAITILHGLENLRRIDAAEQRLELLIEADQHRRLKP